MWEGSDAILCAENLCSETPQFSEDKLENYATSFQDEYVFSLCFPKSPSSELQLSYRSL